MLFVITFEGLILVVALFLYFMPRHISESITALPITSLQNPAQTAYGLPIRLTIPVIQVDSAIEYVGMASDGSMSAPKKQEDVAWYQLGSRPGDIGTAVIAGHFGTWDNGKGSVFDNLDKLQKGDKVTVVDDGGTTITFIVKGRGNFGSNADATDIFRSSDGKSHLNLITCEGVWNTSSQSYPSRLVIFADKE